MQINKLEYYTDFITNHINKKPNNIISANKLYTLFCSVYDLNPKQFTIKSFTPNFLKAYNLLFDEKLQKTSRRLRIGENPQTCMMNIDLKPIFTESQQQDTFVITLNKQGTNTNILKPKVKTHTLVNTITDLPRETRSNPTGLTVNMDMFLDYYVPGTESDPIILTKDFYELYMNLYSKSPEHKTLIPHIKIFKIIFKKYWDIRYPNNNLKEGRKYNDRGFKNIKRIK